MPENVVSIRPSLDLDTVRLHLWRKHRRAASNGVAPVRDGKLTPTPSGYSTTT